MYVVLLAPRLTCAEDGSKLPTENIKLTIYILDYEAKVTTYDDYTYIRSYTTSVDEGQTYTRLANVQPTVTAIPTLSVATTVDEYYSDVTIVNVLVPTGVGATVSVRPPIHPLHLDPS